MQKGAFPGENQQFYNSGDSCPVEYKRDPLDLWRFSLLLRLYSRVNKNAHLLTGKTIANIGAGFGRESYLILGCKPKALILLDIDFTCLIYARNYLRRYDNKFFVCADIHNLPFKDASVDIVMCTEVLHHIDVEPYRGIVESVRVAREGIFLDEARKGKTHDLLTPILVKSGIKKEYEIDHGRPCKFRIDRKLVNEIALKYNLKITFYPFFIYTFDEGYVKTKYNFIKGLWVLFLTALNRILHIFGNRVMVIMSRIEK